MVLKPATATPYSALALHVIESAAAAQNLTIRALGATTADDDGDQHPQADQTDPRLESRIESFELAFRMQMEATDAFEGYDYARALQRTVRPGLDQRGGFTERSGRSAGDRFDPGRQPRRLSTHGDR